MEKTTRQSITEPKIPTDEELKAILQKYPKDEKAYLMGDEFVFLNISLNTFFENFLGDSAKMKMSV